MPANIVNSERIGDEKRCAMTRVVRFFINLLREFCQRKDVGCDKLLERYTISDLSCLCYTVVNRNSGPATSGQNQGRGLLLNNHLHFLPPL